MAALTSLPEQDLIYPSFAASEPVGGVRYAANPDLDAPQRHRLLNPHAAAIALAPVGGRYERQALRLSVTPGSGDTPVVRFDDGPRRWWDTPEGVSHFDCSLERLGKVLARARNHRMIAAQIDEVHGRRAMTVASVIYRDRRWGGLLTRQRPMLCLTVQTPAIDGVLAWSDARTSPPSWNPDHVLVDAAHLGDVVRRLLTAAELAEPIKVDYETWRAR